MASSTFVGQNQFQILGRKEWLEKFVLYETKAVCSTGPQSFNTAGHIQTESRMMISLTLASAFRGSILLDLIARGHGTTS